MNELSIHGQFHAPSEFFTSVDRLMEIRSEIKRHGFELYCHPNIAHCQVTPESPMQAVVKGMPKEKRQAWMQWLTRHGPYWPDIRQHTGDDWLESREEVVTDTAIGEAAFASLHDLSRELVSLSPSEWLIDPIAVAWRRTDESHENVDIRNHWKMQTVAQRMESLPSPFNSWSSLEQYVRTACDKIVISENAFRHLEGHPFVSSAAERIKILLDVLNKLRRAFDGEGNRTVEFEELYKNYFACAEARFTDSSEAEKNQFQKDLTFPHPDAPGQYLFCPWHGKIKTPQFRIHFSYPITANNPLYVVYIGPKITKR